MSKINNWFQIHEVYIDEEANQPTYGEGSGFGTIDGCGSGKGLFIVAPNKDYDNKYGIGWVMVVDLVVNTAGMIN